MALTVALTCLGCEWVEARHPVQALSTSPCDLRNETVWEVQVGLDEYNPNPYALTLTRTRTLTRTLTLSLTLTLALTLTSIPAADAS